MRSSPHLPPLQTLRAFEAVGRLLSFRRAGEELLITQSAVSHHIRRLEDTLGVRLFDRKARSIALTSAGGDYLATITQAFALISEGTVALTRNAARQKVRVSLLPSFAANWLVPRLSRFRDMHPAVDIELEPTLRLANLSAGEADLAIRYGDGHWPGVQCEKLADEALTPVLSPVLADRQPVDTPEALLDHILLFTRNPTDWQVWAEHMGIDLSRARTIQLTDYNIALQAALDGQGVALGRKLLVADRLRTGALVAPGFAEVTSPRACYWLLTPDRRPPSPATRAVIDWLHQEVV